MDALGQAYWNSIHLKELSTQIKAGLANENILLIVLRKKESSKVCLMETVMITPLWRTSLDYLNKEVYYGVVYYSYDELISEIELDT